MVTSAVKASTTKQEQKSELVQLISKIVGYGIVGVSLVLKMPQIVKILKSKSVEGITKYLFYLDIIIYTHYSGYSLHNKIPFSVCGENLIILASNIIIALLIWKYNPKITRLEKIICSSVFLAYSYLLLSNKYLSDAHWSIVAKTNIILLILSRLPQILVNFRNRSTGQLSFVSFLLSFAGYIARLTTVLIETDDILYKLQYVTGTTLTGVLIAQFLLYWNNNGQIKRD
ncbi:hypothetical protein FGO68_gene5434 [Halteria grandinella]|uniref:Mannose-P-dolichol utilization defect 1 protein homolog n=1 Tax=Halteria grandinella TaxID=5974 RepID=A0A8J8NFI4_HALGN|nr:hypothetical protein FGO68_gene5434 [Halteria grandinella]